jgi:hypothetical protein
MLVAAGGGGLAPADDAVMPVFLAHQGISIPCSHPFIPIIFNCYNCESF